MKLTKQQAIEYAKSIKFGLKDLEKTKGKWANYLAKQYSNDNINVSFSIDNAEYKMMSSIQWYYNFGKKGFTLDSKSVIRQVKTMLNNFTFEANQDAMQYETDCTDTQKHGLAIRYYLNNYDLINNEMSELLVQYVKNSYE